MPNCPKCGALVTEDAAFCRNCGSILQPQQPIAPPSLQSTPFPSPQPYPPARDKTRTFVILGFISAVISLLILPEIFGSAAIIIGAYTWKKEPAGSNSGLYILIIGIICLIVGLFIAYFSLFDLILPSS